MVADEVRGRARSANFLADRPQAGCTQKAQMSAPKSSHNPCPVCGKPRGKGRYEFAHGDCAEIRAKTDGKKLAFPGSKLRFTVEHREKAISKKHKKIYLSGNLPDWMFS